MAIPGTAINAIVITRISGTQAPDSRPSRGQRGTGTEGLGVREVGKVRLHSLLWLHRDWTTTCLGVYQQLAIQHSSALSIQLIDTFLFQPHPISHPASLMGVLFRRFSFCITSPVKGSYCVQSIVGIPVLKL